MSGLEEEGPPSSDASAQSPAINDTQPSVRQNLARADIGATDQARTAIEDAHKQCKDLYTEEEQTNAWTNVATKVETYSDKKIKRMIKEIDTYLVFAGLFSAILTAFNVPAYALLNPPDPSIALLQQISSKLDSFSINHPFINSTQPSSTNDLSPNADIGSPVLRWAVWLNGLWFSGLILSLASASMGLLSKQWLNEYSSGVSETSRHAARLRQYRLENLKAWHVEAIVNTIPVLLQLSLVCFLAGLLIFLWNLHNTVAAIASALVGSLTIFTTVVTLLPLWNPKCAYLSPQIRTLYHVWQPGRFAYWVCDCLATFYFFTTGKNPTPPESRLSSIKSWNVPKQTWEGRERTSINKQKVKLDVHILGEAYRITLHPQTLSVVTVCLMGFDAKDVINCFCLLHKYAQEHFSTQAADGHSESGIWGQQQLLWLYVILCGSLLPKANSTPDDPPLVPHDLPPSNNPPLVPHESSPSDNPPLAPHDLYPPDAYKLVLRSYFESGSWPSSMQAATGVWAASTLDALTDYLEDDSEETGMLTKEVIVPLGGLRNETKKLFGSAIDRKEPLMSVVQRVISDTYAQVRLKQKHLMEASSDNLKARDTVTRYLRNAWPQFLEYASHALTLYGRANNLDTVRVCTRDVLRMLTVALLELFAQGEVETTIEWTYLDNVMRKLRDLDETRVEECIPDQLVPNILDLAERLAFTTTNDNADKRQVGDIQHSARALMRNIARVKYNLAATWAYDHVGLEQKPWASSDEVRAAHTRHLYSVDYFLECASLAWKSSTLSSNDRQILCANTWGVLTKLTDTLLGLFETKDQVQMAIESTYLDDVMRKLSNLDDTRVENCIPDELVPNILDLADTLATANSYYDNVRVADIQRSARTLKWNIACVKYNIAAAWAYDHVGLEQKPGASSGEARAAHTSYLQSVDYFLECADRATSASSTLSASGLQIVRENTQVVLTQLTSTLQGLFAKDQVRTAIESTYLGDVMRKLRDFDDIRVEGCIPDELVSNILDLAEILALAPAESYHDSLPVGDIQRSARTFKRNISRVKSKLAAAWAYGHIQLQQKPGAPSDEARAAHTSYLRSVDYFLQCANGSLTSSTIDPDDLNVVCTNIRDVLKKLTDTLLELFETRRVRTTIESTYLDSVMRTLANLDIGGTHMGECITDKLARQILDLAETLATANDYDDKRQVGDIQGSARAFKRNIARFKSKIAATWAYDHLKLEQIPGTSSDDAKAAHTNYLQSVDYFLECADRASTSSTLSTNDLQSVRANTQDVLTQLTGTLLGLFAKDQVQTAIESTYLDDVMRRLRDLVNIPSCVEECIPDELVPEILDLAEKLAMANHYADDDWVDNIQRCARIVKANVTRVKYTLAVTGAYRHIQLQQKPGASPDEARAAHTSYLQSVDYFLECANRASASSTLSSEDLQTVRANTQDVLKEFTGTLLGLFGKDQVRTVIESTYLDDVMRKLSALDDTRVEECISGELLAKILDLSEKLAMTYHYADDNWVTPIQDSARRLHGSIDRVKCSKPTAAWAYHHVQGLEQTPGASSDDAKAVHTNYLQSVDYFLACANQDLKSESLPADALKIVRAHRRDVLNNLTHTLLDLFAKDQVRTVIESTYLDDVMQKLRALDDTPGLVEQCIPDELVPDILVLAEELATTYHYADDDWVDNIQRSARVLGKANITRVKFNLAATWACRHVRLPQTLDSFSDPDEARAAYTGYLRGVDNFLDSWASNASSTSSTLSSDNLGTVGVCTRDVLTKLTHILLDLFAKDQMRTSIESTYLDDVMKQLCDLNDARVQEYVPDDLVAEILDLAEKLATAADYYDNRYVDQIQRSAHAFRENVDRVKRRPGTTTSPETPPALLSAAELATPSSDKVESPDPTVKVDAPSGAARDPGGDSHDQSEDESAAALP